MKDWLLPLESTPSPALETAAGGSSLLSRILSQRGISDAEVAQAYLNPDAYHPTPAGDLPDMAAAADRILTAIQTHEPLCVWGDFDVDGQTSTTTLVAALRELGANVSYYIPVRARETHGVHIPRLAEILDTGVSLVLTCDTGITAHEAVDYARQRGIDMIITDHHDLPPDLPNALAVVDPKRLPDGHPLGTLPGVGVAYKLVEELYRRSGRSGEETQFLDLAAMGIIADLALLTGDTRYLAQRGLAALRSPQRLGLKVMMELAELNPDHLTEEHIGFTIAPRLNALGRLDDANPVVEFLTTTDLTRARVLATQLEGLNARRKLLTDQVFQAALSQIENDPSLLETAALVLSHPSWPGGVIGIVANRLVDRYHKPTILISAPPGETARGSARSINGCNITAAIADQSEMLVGFGGHPMAAGLGIDPERIAEFRRAVSRSVQKQIGSEKPVDTLQIDALAALPDLSLDLAHELEKLAPFGAGSPAVVWASHDLSLQNRTLVGKGGEHVQLLVEDRLGNAQKVIWWQGAGFDLPEGRFDLAYTVRATNYRGQDEVQVTFVDFRPLEEPVEGAKPRKITLEAIDYRQEVYPLPLLKKLQAENDIQVWAEGEAAKHLNGLDRFHLSPTPALAIWTLPPGRAELRSVIKQTSPQQVYLFGIDPQMDQPEIFLRYLSGLIKFALQKHSGQVSIAVLVSATAQRETTVRRGIDWLAASGNIVVMADDGKLMTLAAGGKPTPERRDPILEQLKSLLAESAAFRNFLRRANPETLPNLLSA